MISSVILPFAFVALINAQLELVSVHVVFRHGDRAPSNPYPLDPYDIKYWPNGWSQLTALGASQTEELGSYLRKQYGEKHRLVENFYNPKKVHIRATSKVRAIDSARNLILGLYTLPHEEPVDVKVEGPYNQDLLLKPNSVVCSRYEQTIRAENMVLFQAYNYKFAGFFKYLTHHTGMNVNLENIEKVFDAVFRESVHGLPQPTWLNTTFKLDADHPKIPVYETILELKRVQRLSEFNSEWKSKLRTGFLLGDIVQRMKRISSGSNEQNFLIYSSHDATLTSLLYNMDVGNDLLVPYAAAIIFELYKDTTTNDHFIKVLYRNETSQPAHDLQIIPNSTLYTVREFANTISPKMYLSKEDYFADCAITLNNNNL